MPRVVVSAEARRDLLELIRTRNLPADARQRVRRAIQPLRDFPALGSDLGPAFGGRRFLLGPWHWMILIYRHYPEHDVVVILAIVDGRTSTSPLANR